ncbi:olfactory receptor 14A16-like [Trachemys scripta elegans]|uniref:olfactory receptor 14A16-like n=1 Tax=Trachemys scripta elegans TaxID=31138 RepID=UPI0015537090|nr:olfactory receptor 14A16-like [Trachemys scripta elegans]
MVYDCYVALCQPLHYETIMNKRAGVQMAASAWISGIPISTLETGNIFALTFCGGNMVDQFFCEIPQLLKIACSDSYIGEVVVTSFLLFLGLNCFAFIIVSYVQIFKTVLRIPSERDWHKVFSTCPPHLIVISLLLCTGTFVYLKPTSSSTSGLDVMVAVLYSVVPPLMNPVMYSMRKKEIKVPRGNRLKGSYSRRIQFPHFSHDHVCILCFFTDIIN